MPQSHLFQEIEYTFSNLQRKGKHHFLFNSPIQLLECSSPCHSLSRSSNFIINPVIEFCNLICLLTLVTIKTLGAHTINVHVVYKYIYVHTYLHILCMYNTD